MSKDVNIHVKTEGTGQVNRDLQEVTQGVNRVGDNVEQMSSRSSRAIEWFTNGIKSLTSPLGFAALIYTVANVAGKISQFFSDLKNRCDEAVANLQNLRKGFEGIFEVMDAFDEKSRKRVTKETTELLKKTSVSSEIGLPVIEQYARQFKGKLTPEQYQQGLEGMLDYAERHGKTATPELITLMSGFGMTTPEQQGVFRRQIGAVSKVSGLDEGDIITALGRASPTAKAMGWKPEEILNYIGTLAAGEIDRNKLTLPTATLEALVNPQTGNLRDYRIMPSQAEDPAKLLATIAAKRGKMTEQAFGRMLTDIYGTQAAAGIKKLIMTPGGEMAGTIKEAATPQAATAEMAEEETSRKTIERIGFQTQHEEERIQQDITDEEFYQKQIRDIGAREQARLRIRQPILQKINEMVTPESAEKEDAAFRQWFRNLSPEEEARILDEIRSPSFSGPRPSSITKHQYAPQFKEYFQRLTPQQQYEELTTVPANLESTVNIGPAQQSDRITGASTINNYRIEYHNEIQYFPVAGTAGDRDIGPRAPRDLK
jgi:hypothetical protein